MPTKIFSFPLSPVLPPRPHSNVTEAAKPQPDGSPPASAASPQDQLSSTTSSTTALRLTSAAPLSGRVTAEKGNKKSGDLGKVGARPITLGGRFFGLNWVKALERPQKNGLPPAEHQEESAEGLIDQANALAERVKRTLNTSLEQLANINQRPQRSRAMKIMMSLPLLNCFKPKKLKDLIAQDPAYALQGGNQHQAVASTSADMRERRESLLQNMADRMQVMTDAEKAFSSVRDAFNAETEPPQKTLLQIDLDEAKENFEVAIRDLHAAVVVNTMLDANHNALTTELVSQRMDFVKVQIEQCTEKLNQSGLYAKEQMRLLEMKRDGLQRGVNLAKLNLVNAELTLSEIEGTGRVLKESSQKIGDPLSRGYTELSDGLAYLSSCLQAARDDVEQCAQALEKEVAALEDFLPNFSQEMDVLSRQDAEIEAAKSGLQASGISIAEKAKTWKLRAEETRVLEHAQQDKAISALVAAPPGFPAEELVSAGGQDLKACLQGIASVLHADDPQAERELPSMAIMEIISRAVAGVTAGNAQQAAVLLRDVMSHPSEHWIPLPDTNAVPPDLTHAPPSPAMRQLFQRMAEVPRGIEVLNQIASRDGRTSMGREQLEALHAYWMADKTQEAERSFSMKAWLESAKFVAQHEVHELRKRKKEAPIFDTGSLPLEKVIAFRAVKKGILSNGVGSDFNAINRKLLKVSGQWVEAAQDKRNKLLRLLPHSLNPSKGKTPFHPKALRLAAQEMEAQGMPSIKSSAHDSVVEMAEALLEKVAAGCMTKLPNRANDRQARAFDMTVNVLCEYVAGQKKSGEAFASWLTQGCETKFHHTKRLYKANLERQDIEQIRKEVMARLDLPLNAGSAFSFKWPDPFFQTLFKENKLAPVEAFRRIAEYLDLSIAPEYKEELGLTRLVAELKLDKIDKKIETARQRQFTSKDDVYDFFKPLLQELRLRQQVNLTAGGEKGIGIPLLPWAPIEPFIANLNLNLFSKKDEASFQVKSPTFGVEFMIAETTTYSHDVKGTFGFGVDRKPAKLTLPAFSVKAEKAASNTDFLVLRLLRGKDENGVREEQKARDASLDLLDTLIRWDADDKHPVAGQKFTSPLEAILALHPDILIGTGQKENKTEQLSTDLTIAARFGKSKKPVSASITVTPVAAKAEKATEVSNERTGYAHQVVHDRSDQRKQRLGSAVTLGGIVSLMKKPVKGLAGNAHANKQGTWRVTGGGNLVEFSREMAFNLEKNGATRFAIGDKTGGSVDRVYGSPKDVLAEIEANLEDFYLRFLDTIPLAPGEERDTPENRALAESMLRQFMRDLKAAKKNPALQFNIKYEMQPKMSGWVDALNALEIIALQNGDEEGAWETRKAKSDLMSFRSTWAFKNCAIRSKGKESSTSGLDLFARWSVKQTAETSAALTAYPG